MMEMVELLLFHYKLMYIIYKESIYTRGGAMKIINGEVFNENGKMNMGEVTFENGIILQSNSKVDIQDELYDASGCYVLPGLIDIHIHGAKGVDFSDGNEGDLAIIADYLLKQGVTSFLGTSMSYSEKKLNSIFKKAIKFKENQYNKAGYSSELLGINMEGPFINPEKAGAQNKNDIILPDYEMFQRLWKSSKETIKIIDLAPEMEGAMELVEKISKNCVVSIAHTNANYKIAQEAFDSGARHVTHLFNAMPPLDHREPGVIGAAIEKAKFVELICDGVHIHSSMIRNTFQLFGRERVCLISDSMRATGMGDGEYSLGGQKVFVENGEARLTNGTIAGSITTLNNCLKQAIIFGIPVEDAIQAATMNPAKEIGVFKERGSLSPGKIADISIFDKNFNLVTVFKNGKQRYIQ